MIDKDLDLTGAGRFNLSKDLNLNEAAGSVKVNASSPAELQQYLKWVRILEEDEKFSGFRRWFVPGTPFGIDQLPKHRAFLFSGKDYRQRYFSAANRTGKTIAGAFEMTLHLTGDYPDWWKGKRFDAPVEALVAGKSSETTRDIIQRELLGNVGSHGTGMIPRSSLIDTRSRPGVAGGVGMILVQHKSGGISELLIRSYDQGREAFEGIKRHVVWMDELPDATLYSEAFLRTMTYKGIIYITATAKQGLTPLVLNYYNNSDWLPEGQELPTIVKLVREQKAMGLEEAEDDDEPRKPDVYEGVAKAVIVAGWNDAPWLSEEDKKTQLAETPPHLVSATSTGLPGIGSGTIFTTPLEEVIVKDFPIPDFWKHINGMDVGWNITGAIHVVQNPDTGICYAVAEHKRGQAEPVVHAKAIKNWGDWIPIEIDPASKSRNQSDGKQLFNLYRKEGLRLIEADNAVETGLLALFQMFSTGELKIFQSCIELQKEYVTYSRNEDGKIIKKNDHLMDALRYAIMGLNHARVKPLGRKGRQVHGGERYDI